MTSKATSKAAVADANKLLRVQNKVAKYSKMLAAIASTKISDPQGNLQTFVFDWLVLFFTFDVHAQLEHKMRSNGQCLRPTTPM